MLSLLDLKKKKIDTLPIDQSLDVTDAIKKRHSEIIDLKNVHVKGSLEYDAGLFILSYHLTYDISLPSSRSMEEVLCHESQDVEELFIESDQVSMNQDMVDDNLVLIIDGEGIDLEESVIDNILLAIPLQVLGEHEKNATDLPEGNDWAVLTEEQYAAMKKKTEEENNPFASLQGLFDE